MIYTRFLLRTFICTVLLVCPFLQAQAQLVSPWFRGGKEAWSALLKNTVSQNVRTGLSVPLSGAATGFAVKTTASNWILHRISHSGAFSRMEKDILTAKNQSEKSLLGKLSYFHDRDARLFALLQDNKLPSDAKAFWRHQELLGNALAEIETHFSKVLPERFVSSLFPKEEVRRLMSDPVQPPAYALYPKEAAAFAQLPTLQAQREWAHGALEYTWRDINSLLAKDPNTLKQFEFEHYYRQKLRLEYFKTLNEVLEQATVKRSSLIIRRKRAVPAQIPGASSLPPMTDAQRLGLLHFTLDKRHESVHNLFPDEALLAQYLEVKALLQKMEKIYGVYAAAEAFGAPYETTLKQGAAWPGLLGEEEAARLRGLKGETLFSQLTPQVERLNAQLAALRRQTPGGVDFYARYYRLIAERDIYKTLLARERFFRAFNPE